MPNSITNKFKLIIGAVFALLFVFLSSKPAKATEYYVTPSSACTLPDALVAAGNPAGYGSCAAGTSSNTIYLGAGDYTVIGSLPDVNYDGDLTIVGENPTTTILDGNASNSGLRINPPSSTNNYSISNLTLRNFVADTFGVGDYRSVLAAYKGNLSVNNVIVRNNSCTNENIPVCVLFANSSTTSAANFSITNSAFYYNFAIFLFVAGNLENGQKSSTTNLINNTFSNNNSGIIGVTNVSSDAVVTVNAINNTIANNSTLGGWDSVFILNVTFPGSTLYPAVLNLKNNIMYANNVDSGGGSCPTALGTNATINSLGGNLSSDSSCLPYFISSDKSNVDPLLNVLTLDNGTYVRPLAANSPAIGAAISSGSPSTDQRGVTRPQNGSYDSGSYEYNGPGVPSGGTVYPQAGYLVGTGKDMRFILLSSAFLIAAGLVFASKNIHHRRVNKDLKNKQRD